MRLRKSTIAMTFVAVAALVGFRPAVADQPVFNYSPMYGPAHQVSNLFFPGELSPWRDLSLPWNASTDATWLRYAENYGPALPLPSILEGSPSSVSMTLATNMEFFNAQTLQDDNLNEMRGAFAAETLGVSILEAAAVQNTINGDSITGYNRLQNEAFQNSSGVISVIQNTGNNVIIQNSTIVNLHME